MDTTPPSAAQPELDEEDYYYEGANLVFTAAYHLKRGSCCGAGCRHCPYGVAPAAAGAVEEDGAVPAG